MSKCVDLMNEAIDENIAFLMEHHKTDTVYVDGVLPEYADRFDQVIHVTRKDKTSEQVLRERGRHSEEAIQFILQQKDWK